MHYMIFNSAFIGVFDIHNSGVYFVAYHVAQYLGLCLLQLYKIVTMLLSKIQNVLPENVRYRLPKHIGRIELHRGCQCKC